MFLAENASGLLRTKSTSICSRLTPAGLVPAAILFSVSPYRTGPYASALSAAPGSPSNVACEPPIVCTGALGSGFASTAAGAGWVAGASDLGPSDAGSSDLGSSALGASGFASADGAGTGSALGCGVGGTALTSGL